MTTLERHMQGDGNHHGILFVGPNKHTLRTVTTHLVGYRSVTDDTNDDDDDENTSTLLWSTCGMYTADNKYYSADIPVGWCFDMSHMPSDTIWPAIVFILDEDTMSFFDDMTSWWEQCDEPPRLDVPLVVAWGLCQERHASFLRQVLDWCIDHGFEMIEIDDQCPTVENRDAGMHRLEDALQAHVWPHASMKKRHHQHDDGVEEQDCYSEDNLDDSDPDQMLFEKMMALSQRTCLVSCYRIYMKLVTRIDYVHVCRVSIPGYRE